MVKRSRVLTQRLAAVLAFVFLGAQGRAAPTTIQLGPEQAHVGLTVFALDMFPLIGTFDRFSGRLSVDPAWPGRCRVDLTVEVASLKMPRSMQTSAALGSSLLDAARYPLLRFAGTCMAGTANGTLTMHGVTRSIDLATLQDGDVLSAGGTVIRRDYGVSGMPGLIGGRVSVRFRVKLPAGWAKPAERRADAPPSPAGQPGSNVRAAPFMQ